MSVTGGNTIGTALLPRHGTFGGGGDRATCTRNSFIPDTKVLMEDGSTKAIEELEPGDRAMIGKGPLPRQLAKLGELWRDLGRYPLHSLPDMLSRDGQPQGAGSEPSLGKPPQVVGDACRAGRSAAERPSRWRYGRGDAGRGEECGRSEREVVGVPCVSGEFGEFAQTASHVDDLRGVGAGAVPAVAEPQRAA